jgi:hypothetical protein
MYYFQLGLSWGAGLQTKTMLPFSNFDSIFNDLTKY